MALELFRPFVMKRLVDQNLAQNIKSAKRRWSSARLRSGTCSEVIREHPVALNRAPTLRLGIQAFEPVLVEGKAIQIHPLVCTAFNADFDGDQINGHVPLSRGGPGGGGSSFSQQQHPVAGARPSDRGADPGHDPPGSTTSYDRVAAAGKTPKDEDIPRFGSVDGCCSPWTQSASRCTTIKVRLPGKALPADLIPGDGSPAARTAPTRTPRIQTTAGRVLFNQALPDDFEYQNMHVLKGDVGKVVDEVRPALRPGAGGGRPRLAEAVGFHYAAGGRHAGHRGRHDAARQAADPRRAREARVEGRDPVPQGIITDDERRREIIEIWTQATDEVKDAMEDGFSRTNPIYMMANSGARGNIMQIRQLAGMRGLVANPKGEIIPRPIKASFRRPHCVLSTSSRRTVPERDWPTPRCGRRTPATSPGAWSTSPRAHHPRGGLRRRPRHPDHGDHRAPRRRPWKNAQLDTSAYGRVLAEDVKSGRTVVGSRNEELNDEMTERLVQAGVGEVIARSVTTCGGRGRSARCATGGTWRPAAWSRSASPSESSPRSRSASREPSSRCGPSTRGRGGRGHHARPAAGGRAVRGPQAQGRAQITELPGRVEIEDDEDKKVRKITVTSPDGDQVQYAVSLRARLLVSNGDEVDVGEQLTERLGEPARETAGRGRAGAADAPGGRGSAGVSVAGRDDRQAHRAHRATDAPQGASSSRATTFLPGDMVDRKRFEETNAEVVEGGGEPASARPLLLGITKASLATDSWLAAASFQNDAGADGRGPSAPSPTRCSA